MPVQHQHLPLVQQNSGKLMSDLGHVMQFFPLIFTRYHQDFTLYEITCGISKPQLLQNTAVTDAVLVTAFSPALPTRHVQWVSHTQMFNVTVVGGQCPSRQEHVDTRYCPNSTPGKLAGICCCHQH